MLLLDPVDWNADALVVLEPGEPAVSERGGILFQGTVADAVARFLGLPQAEREHAKIVIVHEGGTWNTWRMPSDIEELGLRPDYPLRT